MRGRSREGNYIPMEDREVVKYRFIQADYHVGLYRARFSLENVILLESKWDTMSGISKKEHRISRRCDKVNEDSGRIGQ